jgi:pilus assembly protein Flp/PilA
MLSRMFTGTLTIALVRSEDIITLTIFSKERAMNTFVKFAKDESGVTAIEYGLIAAATGLALAAVMPVIKTNLTTTFTAVSDNMN